MGKHRSVLFPLILSLASIAGILLLLLPYSDFSSKITHTLLASIFGATFFYGLSAIWLTREISRIQSADPHDDHYKDDDETSFSSITGLYQAVEEENAKLIRRYQILTDNLAAAIIVRNADGSLAYCSPYTEVLTGYSLDTIYSSTDDFFLSTLLAEEKEKYQRALNMTILGEPFQFRYRFRHSSGIDMWAETRTVPIMDAQGKLLSSLSVTIDVTGTVRYQQQVEEKNRDLQDFTYMVTHDLKAPIHTLLGMLHVLEEDCGPQLPTSAQEPLSHMHGAAKRLDALVRAVLEYARLTSFDSRLEPIVLDRIIEEVLRDYQPDLERIGATLLRSPELPTMIGDRTPLYQIFSNLIGNAIKYRRPEIPLRIEIEPVSTERRAFVCIAIRDNGMGIPEAKLSDIFRPFHRVHVDKKIVGCGIGLACVRKLVEKIGGDVEVESEVDKGSTFYLYLRRSDSKIS